MHSTPSADPAVLAGQVQYSRASDLSDELVFQAFVAGFSDYLTRFTLDIHQFDERFFVTERNVRECSYVAHIGDVSLGFALGGVEDFHGAPTFRCGAFAVVPAARGQGVADNLMRMHLDAAAELGAPTATLEVLSPNSRAMRFYERFGYERTAELEYWQAPASEIPGFESPWTGHIRKVRVEDILPHWRTVNFAPPRESDPATIDRLAAIHIGLAVGDADDPDAFLIGTQKGEIRAVWVRASRRGRGLGSALVRTFRESVPDGLVKLCVPSAWMLAPFFESVDLAEYGMRQFVMRRSC